jgi:hypothetical protein
MHSINPEEKFEETEEKFEETLGKLNFAYGFGFMEPSMILNELRGIKFHPAHYPQSVFEWIDKKTVELATAGGEISTGQLVQYIHDGLSGDSLRDNFWFQCRGEMMMKGLASYTVETAKKYVIRFWNAYRPKSGEIVNQVSYNPKKKWEDRCCDFCKEKGLPERVYATHDIKSCLP